MRTWPESTEPDARDVFREMRKTIVDGWWDTYRHAVEGYRDVRAVMAGRWWGALWWAHAAVLVALSVGVLRHFGRAPAAAPTAFGFRPACSMGQYLSSAGICETPPAFNGVKNDPRLEWLDLSHDVTGVPPSGCKVLRWNGAFMECAAK